jgi:hypothetical protein
MKKATSKKRSPARSKPVPDDEILPEYDFRSARRNPYAARFQAGVTVVQLDPDVATSFPDATSVNDALRALAKIARRQPKKASSKRRTA